MAIDRQVSLSIVVGSVYRWTRSPDYCVHSSCCGSTPKYIEADQMYRSISSQMYWYRQWLSIDRGPNLLMTAMAIDRVRANLFVAAMNIDWYMSESTVMYNACRLFSLCRWMSHLHRDIPHLESTLHYVEVRGIEAVGEYVLRVWWYHLGRCGVTFLQFGTVAWCRNLQYVWPKVHESCCWCGVGTYNCPSDEHEIAELSCVDEMCLYPGQ